MSSPPAAPPDSVSSFRRDTLNIVSVEVLFFGFYICLFFTTMYAVWNSHSAHRSTKREGKTIRLVQSILLVISFILSALHVALDWWYPAHMFQTDGGSPLLVLDFLAEQPVFFLVIEALTLAFNTAITDSVSAWRCWVLYNRNFKVILFPVLCIVASVVMAIVALIDRIQFTFGLQHMTVNPTVGIARWQHLLIAYFAPSLAATVYTTTLIIYHIGKAHFQLAKVTRTSFSSAKVAIMIVESALLYTISHVVTMGLLVQVSPDFNFSQDILAQMAGISPTLLILRVCVGQYSESIQQDAGKMTSLAFQSRSSGRTGTDTMVDRDVEIDDYRTAFNFNRTKS